MSMHIVGRWHVVAMAALMTLGIADRVHAEAGINGRVFGLDEKGIPMGSVVGAKIEFKNAAGKLVGGGISDKKGRYKVKLPPGTYTYKIQAAGFKDENAARAITLTLSDGFALHNFSLSRGKTDPNRKVPKTGAEAVGFLKGKVQGKTADGKTIDVPDATISLRKAGDKKLTKVVAQGKDPKKLGQYEVTLAAGSYQISVSAAGFETLVVTDPQTIAGGKLAPRNFMLAPAKHAEPSGQGIKGSIQFTDAKSPPAKVKVSIRLLSEAGPSTPIDPDAKGAFQRDLRAGRYQVVAEADGFRTATSEPKDVLNGSYTVVALRLTPTGTPAGKDLVFVATVYEGSAKKPLAGATVTLRKLPGPLAGAPKGTTGADGKVSLKAGAVGQHQMIASMKGYKTAAKTVAIVGGDNHAELELVKDGSAVASAAVAMYVRIVEAKDKITYPVAEAKVVVSQQGKTIQTGAADAKGIYTVKLLPGVYQVDVTHAGFTPARKEVTVAAAEVRPFVILTRATTATAKTMLNLYIVERLNTGDKPVAGAQIAINQKNKSVGGNHQSDKDGRLTLPLPAGSYTVVVTKTGYKPTFTPVDIATQDVSKEIPLAALAGPPTKNPTLNVNVVERLRSGDKTIDRPSVGAEIAILQKDKRIPAAKSGPDGKSATALPAGSYSVTVSKPGFKAVTYTVEVAALDVNKDFLLNSSDTPPTKLATLNVHVVEQLKAGAKAIDLPGAQIVITQKGKMVVSGKSGTDGRYQPALAAGTYQLEVSRVGYQTIRESVTIADQNVPREILLKRGK